MPISKSLSVLRDPHSILCIVLVVCYNYHRVGWSKIITLNLSIFSL